MNASRTPNQIHSHLVGSRAWHDARAARAKLTQRHAYDSGALPSLARGCALCHDKRVWSSRYASTLVTLNWCRACGTTWEAT